LSKPCRPPVSGTWTPSGKEPATEPPDEKHSTLVLILLVLHQAAASTQDARVIMWVLAVLVLVVIKHDRAGI
jgi:hypothetical protein